MEPATCATRPEDVGYLVRTLRGRRAGIVLALAFAVLGAVSLSRRVGGGDAPANPTGLPWIESLGEALATARKEGRLCLVYAYQRPET